jgi:hypothetical protein
MDCRPSHRKIQIIKVNRFGRYGISQTSKSILKWFCNSNLQTKVSIRQKFTTTTMPPILCLLRYPKKIHASTILDCLLTKTNHLIESLTPPLPSINWYHPNRRILIKTYLLQQHKKLTRNRIQTPKLKRSNIHLLTLPKQEIHRLLPLRAHV